MFHLLRSWRHWILSVSYTHLKAKVFPKENGAIRKKIGCPDLMVLFTNTVSHKMVISASQEAKKNNIPVARIHTSSASALKCALDEHAVMA